MLGRAVGSTRAVGSGAGTRVQYGVLGRITACEVVSRDNHVVSRRIT